MLKILYLASLRERLQTAQEQLSLPQAVSTVGQLREFLRTRGADWELALSAGRNLRVAVDQEMAEPDTPLRGNEEVAFFPPVTGG